MTMYFYAESAVKSPIKITTARIFPSFVELYEFLKELQKKTIEDFIETANKKDWWTTSPDYVQRTIDSLESDIWGYRFRVYKCESGQIMQQLGRAEFGLLVQNHLNQQNQ